MFKVIDNYLKLDEHLNLKSIMESDEFSWFYNPEKVIGDGGLFKSQFVHIFYKDNIVFTALAASLPFLPRAIACFLFKHVIIPLPIGFFDSTDIFIIASVVDLDMKSK